MSTEEIKIYDVGISFPFSKKKPVTTSELTPTEEANVQLVADSMKNPDYIAKLSVPLANSEKTFGEFIKFMLQYFMMFNMRIKNVFAMGTTVFEDKEHYNASMKEMDGIQKDIMAIAQQRADANKGNWFTSAIIQEESMSPADVKTIFKVFKKHGKNAPVDQNLLSDITHAETGLPKSKEEMEEENEEQDDVQKSIVAIDPFASPETVAKQTEKFTATKDAALDSELTEIKKNESEIMGMLQEMRDEKAAEEEQEAKEAEKERHENRFMMQKLGLVSKVFRQFDLGGRAFQWGYSNVTHGVAKSKLMQHGLEWITKLPLDQMFDFTMIRGKLDTLIFHHLGLHQGSYIYNMVNKLLSKMWFVFEPIINGYNKIVLKLGSMHKTFFEKYGTGIVKYGGGAINIYQYFYSYYVKLVWVLAKYILAICFGIYFWYILFMIKLIRFIINLVLARFGISI